SVLDVRARPAHASLSVTSPASSTPIDGATPTPTVPITCIRTSTIIVRRWMRCAAGSGVVTVVVVGLVNRLLHFGTVGHRAGRSGERWCCGSVGGLQDGAEPHLAVAEALHGLCRSGQ